MALVINQQEKESVVVLKLSGKLTSEEECDAFNKQIEDLLQEAKNKIILNLEEVNFCNSSGLGCLVRALESTRRQNGDLKLLSPSQNVGSIGREALDRRVDLFEELRDRGRIVLAALRKRRRHDEAVVIHADMQLPPYPARLQTLVPVGVPLTGTRDLQSSGIDDQMYRAIKHPAR